MRQRLKLGFVGGGLNSAVGRTHAIASQMDRRWELVAGAFSRHSDINRQTGEAWGIDSSRVYESWTSLLRHESACLDAVVVLTPTPQHAEQVSALLDAGFNVISEKALASSSRHAFALHEQALRQRRFLAVTFNYSGYPMVRELRARAQSKELGRIVAVDIEMPQEGFLRLDASGKPIQPQQWRQHDASIPTISLDLGTHTHHLAQFILGTEPIEVVATQSHHGKVNAVADHVSCLARYPDDIDISLRYGKCALGQRNGLRVRVYGELGSAEWTQMDPETVKMSDAYGNVRIVDRASPGARVASQARYERFKAGHPAGFLEAFANLYWDLADSILSFQKDGAFSSEYVYDAADAACGLRMLEAIADSSERRQWCPIASG